MVLIQAYAPTSSCEIEEAEEFYAALQHAMENIHKQDTLYILGDFNAKIGHEMSREEKVKGMHCLGNRNERGQMLVDFCIEKRLAIGNSFFKIIQEDCLLGQLQMERPKTRLITYW